MFLNTKTLLAALALFAVTGCVNTVNLEQQQKITELQSSLNASKTLTTKTKIELNDTSATLKASEDKITELTTALVISENAVKLAKSEIESLVLRSQAKQPAPTPAPIEVIHLDDKTILGQLEWVYISIVKDAFRARIDTGAATSSLNALNIERFERDGKKWVRFDLSHHEGENAKIIEAKVLRTAKIIQSSNPDSGVERPVIQLHVRIGDISQLTEFTLTNRSHMEYPVLIGRTFMRDVTLVDVSKEYNLPKYQVPAEK